ncbi:organosulfonate ABC transporter substrate-binding protein [Halalkalibacter wakoensis JCM 9140]|uniref:Organosulfonate ABC transporter substrate-binding protein n=1 Tax=Halalkalibacter wakoensis JCM 9140 TaxID=1236970 RepID=W4Q4V6_9BACI|nr:helix-turn-helix domain-containing protein [Halalkalibacter wakoensis]GAE26748.1 organosulfonate ABC transporter substrate-binding protein [Halalkalibacter wakoensis JCM 9140]
MNHLDLITMQEAIDLLEVSRSTIDRWRKFKRLPFIKIGKEIYFHKEEIQQWVRQHSKVHEPIDENRIDQTIRMTTPDTITIGYQSQTAHMWSPLLMKKLGFFEEELAELNPTRPLQINWINAKNGLELIEGMIAGQIQIASLGDYPIMIGHQLSTIFPNFNPVLLAFDGKTSQSEGISLVIPKDLHFHDVTDLHGHTLATVTNSSAGHRLNRLLSGINATCEVINQDMNLSYSNIIERGVGVSVMWEPYVSLSELQGAATMHFDGFTDDYLTGLVALDHWAQLNDDIVIAYLKAHMRTHQFAREYPLKAAKLLSELTGISHRVTTSIVSKVRWDAAVYKQDLETLKNLSITDQSFTRNVTGSKGCIPYRGYYLNEASKRLQLTSVSDRPLEGDWSLDYLY